MGEIQCFDAGATAYTHARNFHYWIRKLDPDSWEQIVRVGAWLTDSQGEARGASTINHLMSDLAKSRGMRLLGGHRHHWVHESMITFQRARRCPSCWCGHCRTCRARIKKQRQRSIGSQSVSPLARRVETDETAVDQWEEMTRIAAMGGPGPPENSWVWG